MGRDVSSRTELRVGDRVVAVSSPDKVMWPHSGFTKGQMIEFYLAVHEALLPHVRGRPLTLKRAPGGTDGQWWYQTQCPHPPEWMSTIAVVGARGQRWDYCTANEPAALAWLANLGCVELHPLLFEAAEPERPRELIFDLDPGPGAGMPECCQTALWLRHELAQRSLRAFVKTSGLTGLHLHVPLGGESSFSGTKAFARMTARRLVEAHPNEVTDNKASSQRTGRVLIDWSQNDRFRSIVAPYSLRLAPLPLVATPVSWAEVATASRSLVFLPDDVLTRLDEGKDPFTELTEVQQQLPRDRDVLRPDG